MNFNLTQKEDSHPLYQSQINGYGTALLSPDQSPYVMPSSANNSSLQNYYLTSDAKWNFFPSILSLNVPASFINTQPWTPDSLSLGTPSFYSDANVIFESTKRLSSTFSESSNEVYRKNNPTNPLKNRTQRLGGTAQSNLKLLLPSRSPIQNSCYISKNELLSLKDIRFCFLCETTDTPQWRRGPDGRVTLCNACGIRYGKCKKEAECFAEKSLKAGKRHNFACDKDRPSQS
jgi:hypothetical protein